MLREDMKKYTELTGEDATHVPIMKIGAYLDGYEKGTEVLAKIRAEIAELDDADYDYEGYYKAVTDAVKIIDKYKSESEDQK